MLLLSSVDDAQFMVFGVIHISADAQSWGGGSEPKCLVIVKSYYAYFIAVIHLFSLQTVTWSLDLRQLICG